MVLIGKINADEFKSNIENNAKGTAESKGEEDFPMIVNVDGYTFEVQANGTIEEVKGLTIPTNLEIIKDQTKELTATLSKDITGEIKWNIEDGNVVELSTTIGNSTTITAKGEAGSSTKITASIEINGETITDECIVTIVSKVTAISVSDFEIETGEEKTIEVSTTPTENVEKLTYTYNITSNPEFVTIDTDGKVKGISVGTATITITGVGESGTNVTANCNITVKQPKLPIGEYVEYNVSYTDMYVEDIDAATEGNQGFTANNGWRILDVGTRNEDGSYSGAKIISTGVPASLYFGYNIQDKSWWGTSEEAMQLYGKTGDCYLASAGLFKKFKSISLTTNTEELKKGEDFVKTDKASDVHNLTLSEINTAFNKKNNATRASNCLNDISDDLFKLINLNAYKVKNVVAYYWYCGDKKTSSGDSLGALAGTGVFAYSNNSLYGVRPVVTLTKDIYKDNGIWKIR